MSYKLVLSWGPKKYPHKVNLLVLLNLWGHLKTTLKTKKQLSFYININIYINKNLNMNIYTVYVYIYIYILQHFTVKAVLGYKHTWSAVPASAHAHARTSCLWLSANDHNWWTTIPEKRHQQSGAKKKKDDARASLPGTFIILWNFFGCWC